MPKGRKIGYSDNLSPCPHAVYFKSQNDKNQRLRYAGWREIPLPDIDDVPPIEVVTEHPVCAIVRVNARQMAAFLHEFPDTKWKRFRK